MQINRRKLRLMTLMILMCVVSCSTGSSFGLLKRIDRLAFYETLYFVVNATTPPFDNVLVRYALAMATDRQAVAAAMREEKFKYFPGISLVPSYDDYTPLNELKVEVESNSSDTAQERKLDTFIEVAKCE